MRIKYFWSKFTSFRSCVIVAVLPKPVSDIGAEIYNARLYSCGASSWCSLHVIPRRKEDFKGRRPLYNETYS